MTHLRAKFIVVCAAATLVACAPVTQQAGNHEPVHAKTQLVVDNHNWLDVAVYLIRGSMRTRVGTVNSMSTGEFTIPDAYVIGVSDINVQATAIGSNAVYNSGPIQVFPGARVNLQVENQMRLSNFSVFGAQ